MSTKRIYYFDGKELTLEHLKSFPEEAVIAEGYGFYPRLYNGGDIHWVAVRGGIGDWALYYHFANFTTEQVMEAGDKSFTEAVIRELVPCTDEAFKMYRH